MESIKQPVARLHWGAEEYLLYPGQLVRLGRAIENDIIFNDPKISRSHAELDWNGTGFVLRDLGSINGTFVNGQQLANATRLLRDGDEILLSKLSLFYEIVRVESAELPVDSSYMGATQPLFEKSAYLVVSAGPDLSQEYPLWGETITIGRASRDAVWEIRLTDRAVSRPHARLEHREDGFYLSDMDSANGSMLNGLPVQASILLKEGDVIAVGETLLTFHSQ